MDLERIFSAANTLVLPGWLLLVLLPRWRFTTSLVTSVMLPGLLSIAYAVIAARAFGSGTADFSAFGSLAGVKGLFQDDALLLGGWIHYLAFDLFIGSWEVRDARRIGVHHLMVIPCLAFTFMLGPVGLLAYLVLRFAARGQWMIDESPSAKIAN